MNPICSAQISGLSAPVVQSILQLHLPGGGLVIDLTHGAGGFWTWNTPEQRCLFTGLPRYVVIGQDRDVTRRPAVVGDATYSPFRSDCADCVVLDPPWGGLGGAKTGDVMGWLYRLGSLGSEWALWKMYDEGIAEAARIAKTKGLVIVKGQDFINGGKRHFVMARIINNAPTAGLSPIDSFIQVAPGAPRMRHTYQEHSRSNWSWYLVLRKKFTPTP